MAKFWELFMLRFRRERDLVIFVPGAEVWRGGVRGGTDGVDMYDVFIHTYIWLSNP